MRRCGGDQEAGGGAVGGARDRCDSGCVPDRWVGRATDRGVDRDLGGCGGVGAHGGPVPARGSSGAVRSGLAPLGRAAGTGARAVVADDDLPRPSTSQAPESTSYQAIHDGCGRSGGGSAGAVPGGGVIGHAGVASAASGSGGVACGSVWGAGLGDGFGAGEGVDAGDVSVGQDGGVDAVRAAVAGGGGAAVERADGVCASAGGSVGVAASGDESAGRSGIRSWPVGSVGAAECSGTGEEVGDG